MARPVIFSKAKATIRPVQRLDSFIRITPLLDFPGRPVKMPWEWITPVRVILPTRDGWREIKEKTLRKTATGLGRSIWNIDRGASGPMRHKALRPLRL